MVCATCLIPGDTLALGKGQAMAYALSPTPVKSHPPGPDLVFLSHHQPLSPPHPYMPEFT